jgi:GrpB-like predicted nucleotidyltransferase (UPF0157 family)
MKPIQSLQNAADDTPYVVQYNVYDSHLPDVFKTVKSLIQSAIGEIAVEHVGSSSIPGVGGRNVLDIAMPVAEENQPMVKRALCELGFEDSSFPHYLPLLVGQITYESKSYQILLYVVAPESDVLADWIEFRDYMRGHAEEARAYDATKREAIANGKVMGDDYQAAKTPFINTIAEKLRQ